MILSLDVATRKTGWCAGSGETIPTVGAILMDQHGEDIGAMLSDFHDKLSLLMDRFAPALVVFEAPILPSGGGKGAKGPVMGSLLTRRKLFALGAHVEFVCHRRCVPCAEEEVRAIKRELAGSTKASKNDMVNAALKCGVQLPEALAHGREDAADSFGIWLLGLRHMNRTLSAQWDRRLYSARGALL